jgi:bifunctional non-homologous end joining protein LigD
VDWSQNDEHKTTVAVYSLRARERPTVSTPVKWEEVERAFKKKHAGLLRFEAPQAVARAEKMGDLFEPVLKLKQKLPDVRGAGVGEAAVQASEPERIQLAAQAEARPTPAARVQPKKAATKRTGNKAANKFEPKPVAKDGKKPSLTAAKSRRRV